jgi:hypothetical protein
MGITDAGVILAIIVSLGGLVWQIIKDRKRQPSENLADQGSAAIDFANAADLMAKKAAAAEAKADKIEIEMKAELKTATTRIAALEDGQVKDRQVIEDLKDWADRLCHQVQSLGGIPVTMRKRNGRIEA